jgi:hypothetical protein
MAAAVRHDSRISCITAHLRPRASACGGADALRGALGAKLQDILWTIQLSVDGEDILLPHSRPLTLQLGQYFGPFDAATTDRVSALLAGVARNTLYSTKSTLR